MPELLFEIGVEELPALTVEPATQFIKSFMENRFLELGLSYGTIETYGTPRRLVVLVSDLSSKQNDSEEEILGPSIAIAYDASGTLTKAGEGFIAAKGISKDKIFKKSTPKGEVIAATKRSLGAFTKDLLPSLLLELMRAIPFKKRMRWEGSGDSFARPISSMVCLFDGEYLSFRFANVETQNTARGHRFMSPEPFLVSSIEQYKNEMRKRFVILSSEEREHLFIKAAEEKLAPLSAHFRSDPELMATVRNLFEYPFAILGSFEEKYLAIPHEILICEMKAHQKCFAVHNKDERLLPYFICSAATLPFDEQVFAKGNARVLRARFEDGAFYFAEDQKKSLRQHGLLLSSLVFERELGTMADKTERIRQLALSLTKIFNLNNEALIEKAAPLLKADLVTGVVGQFPELQGSMGKIYAGLDGEDPAACEIIESHYWPRFAEDQLPKSKMAALFSIADKLDTLVGIIAIGKKPSGNKDPFGLRRAAIGIVRILVHFGLQADLNLLIEAAVSAYPAKEKLRFSEQEKEITDFIIQRARGILIEDLGKESKEYAVNFADSALAAGSNNILDTFARAHTLYIMRNRNRNDFDSLVQAFKRASNIVKKAEINGDKFTMQSQHEQHLTTGPETELLNAIKQTKSFIDKDTQKQADFDHLSAAYSNIFSQIATIKPKLDTFFDSVMVMVDDEKVRNARLALLGEIKHMADRVADFTHL